MRRSWASVPPRRLPAEPTCPPGLSWAPSCPARRTDRGSALASFLALSGRHLQLPADLAWPTVDCVGIYAVPSGNTSARFSTLGKNFLSPGSWNELAAWRTKRHLLGTESEPLQGRPRPFLSTGGAGLRVGEQPVGRRRGSVLGRGSAAWAPCLPARPCWVCQTVRLTVSELFLQL